MWTFKNLLYDNFRRNQPRLFHTHECVCVYIYIYIYDCFTQFSFVMILFVEAKNETMKLEFL